MPRKSKMVDDVLLHDQSIHEAFFHVFGYLQLCTWKGITINPGKFKFPRTEVDFVSYHIGWEGYRPSNDVIAAVRDFPMPENPTITDIRSWFGLVNQLAPFLAMAPMMAPFETH